MCGSEMSNDDGGRMAYDDLARFYEAEVLVLVLAAARRHVGHTSYDSEDRSAPRMHY